MPLFDYHCETCFHEFEALQAISDEPMTVCPKCDASTLKKKPAAPAFTLKGSGWYKDLYGSPGSKKNASTSTADSESTKKETTKKETTKTTSGSAKSTDA